MTTTTTATVAEELRTAATKLRDTAKAATRGPWHTAENVGADGNAYGKNHIGNWGGEYLDSVADAGDGAAATADAAWICLANPLLAEPLAAWLESWEGVDLREDGPLPEDFARALKIARVLNGGAS